MMKKVILTLIAVCAASYVFAENANKQKIWPVDNQVYKNLTVLYSMEGRALPNSQGPWSTDELEKMFNTLSGDYESGAVQDLYEQTEAVLFSDARFGTSDGFKFDLRGTVAPEFYIHSNSNDFNQNDDWDYDYHKRQELLSLDVAGYVSRYLYGTASAGLGYSSFAGIGADKEIDYVLYKKNFVSNIPYISGIGFGYLDNNFPRRALLAFGGNHWSVSAGRDVIRWGNGETGNLFIGGNQKYDNSIRLTAYYNKFKFSFISSFYPFIGEVSPAQGQNDLCMNGFNMLMAHRYDFRLFRDKLNLSIAESVMYQNGSGTLDLRFFNPFMIYHSLFIRGNANSMMSIDADFSPAPGFNIYGQFVIDEMSFFNEPGKDSETGWRPSKYGFMLGGRYTVPVMQGILKVNLEGVYTDPYLYLREAYTKEGEYGVSFYGHLRECQDGGYIRYIRECTGYKYGGDAVVGDVKASYELFGRALFTGEVFYMAHGIMYNDLGNDNIVGQKTYSPSTFDQTGTANPSGPVQHLLRFSLGAEYQILDWMKVYGGTDNFFVWNKGNQNRGMVYDFQLYTGVKMMF